MITKREEQLSRRHASWTPEQVASLLAEYREDMACAALRESLHAPSWSQECSCPNCGADAEVEVYSGQALVHFAERCRSYDMFGDANPDGSRP